MTSSNGNIFQSRYWPFVRGIHRSPMNSPLKGQWRGALMFSLICALNKRLSKQWWGWWFETSSRSLWRHCNVLHTSVTQAAMQRAAVKSGRMVSSRAMSLSGYLWPRVTPMINNIKPVDHRLAMPETKCNSHEQRFASQTMAVCTECVISMWHAVRDCPGCLWRTGDRYGLEIFPIFS